jgi:hypothetical protein
LFSTIGTDTIPTKDRVSKALWNNFSNSELYEQEKELKLEIQTSCFNFLVDGNRKTSKNSRKLQHKSAMNLLTNNELQQR